MSDDRAGWDVWGSRLATALLGLAVLAVLGLAVGPLFLPYKVFTVYSGSMTPTIPIGAEVVDTAIPASAVKPGDVITFPDPDKPDRRVTHRVVSLQHAGAQLMAVTKGDANASPDTWRVPLSGTALRVAFNVPYLGYALNSVEQPRTRILLVVLVGLLALLFVRDVWATEHEDPWR